jgi:hypothetical protein
MFRSLSANCSTILLKNEDAVVAAGTFDNAAAKIDVTVIALTVTTLAATPFAGAGAQTVSESLFVGI